MPSTTYKGYTIPTTGSLSGTWGDEINNNFTTIADLNIGGYATQSLSASNVALSSTQSNSAIVRLTGTLLANVQVTSTCQGFQFVENLTTGSFTVTWTNGVAGVVIPQGRRVLVIADSTNGCRLGVTSFESGTRMAFQQTTPPTGWTKVSDATYNNAAFRMVTGSASTGGTAAFTTAFTSRTPTGTVGATTLTTNQIPAHTHDVTLVFSSATASIVSAGGGPIGQFATRTSSSTGGGASHDHAWTGDAMDFAVKYVDLVLATAD